MSFGPPPSDPDARLRWIRRAITQLSFDAKSAHLGSSLSCVEILDAVITRSNLRPDNAASPDRDRIVVSKGHAAMGWYATLAAWDLLPRDFLGTYLSNDSALWGHVTRTAQVPAIDASTGSLGHGLSVAVGFGLANRIQRRDARSFCVMSDGECDEGSTWEAISFAGHHRLGKVVAVVDYNKIQSIGRCEEVLTKEPFDTRWEMFGWKAVRVDGHDRDALLAAMESHDEERPLVLLADTIKGKGIPRIEDTVWSHYKPALPEDLQTVKS